MNETAEVLEVKPETKEVKTRNTDKKRIEALEQRLDNLTQLIRCIAYNAGISPDLLINNGVQPLGKDEKLDVYRKRR